MPDLMCYFAQCNYGPKVVDSLFMQQGIKFTDWRFDIDGMVVASALVLHHTHRQTHKGHTATNRPTHTH